MSKQKEESFRSYFAEHLGTYFQKKHLRLDVLTPTKISIKHADKSFPGTETLSNFCAAQITPLKYQLKNTNTMERHFRANFENA